MIDHADRTWWRQAYPLPMADGGYNVTDYNVTDYRDIDPAFGTLADAGTLIAEAHRHSIRMLVDLVPNHTALLAGEPLSGNLLPPDTAI